MGLILIILIYLYKNREFSFLELKNLSFHAISARRYTGKLCTGKDLYCCQLVIVVSEDQGYLMSSKYIAGLFVSVSLNSKRQKHLEKVMKPS